MKILLAALLCTLIFVLIIYLFGRLLDMAVEGLVTLLAKAIGPKGAYMCANFLTFPGTMYHELSHALFATITGAKVTKVTLFKPQGDSLGSVEMITRGNMFAKSVQLCLTAIAPMIMGSVAEILIGVVLLNISMPIWLTVILIYVAASIFLHMTMSPQDIKSSVKGLPLCALILFSLFIILFLFDRGPFASTVLEMAQNILNMFAK